VNPIRLVTLMEVASLPKMMKPVIGGEAMSKHSPDLPGWLGTARRNRSVEEPGRPGRVGKPKRPEGIHNQGIGLGRESGEAHSSEEVR